MKNVSKFYELLYCKLYLWDLANFGKNNYPQYNALIGVSALITMNLLCIPGVWHLVLGHQEINTFTSYPKWFVVFFFFVLNALNYFIFVKDGKYKKLCEKWENQERGDRIRTNVYVWAYILFTVFAMFAPAFMLPIQN